VNVEMIYLNSGFIGARIECCLSFFLGLSIVLVSQTAYRLQPGIGFGELGVALYVFFAFVNVFVNGRIKVDRGYKKDVWLIFSYIVMVLLPVTVIGLSFDVDGASFRDWIAYLLSVCLVLAMIFMNVDARFLSRIVIVSFLLLVGFQYFFGVERAWYGGTRFTGGAVNPNQLALYVVCLLPLIFIARFERLVFLLVISLLLFFGAISFSDALFASLAASVFFLVFVFIFPKRLLVIGVFVLLVLFFSILLLYLDSIVMLADLWASVDEGGARLNLYVNGLSAWLDNPFTIFLGNGAGVFSGVTSPFQQAEAHNTPIDILSIGGVVGLFVFYLVPIKNVWKAYSYNERFVFAFNLGLLVFSLFHFVLRQPIFWFVEFIIAQYLAYSLPIRSGTNKLEAVASRCVV